MVVKSKRAAGDAMTTAIPPSIQPHPPLSPRSDEPLTPPLSFQGGVAMSKVETVLLSATGDVLVSRCRKSSQAYMIPPERRRRKNKNENDSDLLWCGLENLDQSSVLNLCAPDYASLDVANRHVRGGLLGGKGETSDVPESDVRPKQNNVAQESASDSLSSTVPVSPKPPINADGDSFQDQLGPDGKSDNLFPLPSFDYSHFADNGNDMIPGSEERNRSKEETEMASPSYLAAVLEGEKNESQTQRTDLSIPDGSDASITPSPDHDSSRDTKDPMCFGGDIEPVPSSIGRLRPAGSPVSPPMVIHGVPTFLSSLAQISIKQVSAHPLGSHVLLISKEALLFSFGLNDHGQLGIGRTSSSQDENQGFVTSPTIVTPLLENGGKAIACAAGVDHSLVVVNTDGRRMSSVRKNAATRDSFVEMSRVVSSPPRIIGTDDESLDQSTTSSTTADPSELIYHHQMYGFGRNNCMKLGLVNPVVKDACAANEDQEEDVPLPRRVALHCSVWPGTSGGPTPGIFAISASEQHSAALVRRATGAIELYTWGFAGDGALGPHNLVDEMSLIDDSRRKTSTSADTKENRKQTKMNGTGSKPRRSHNVGTPSVVRKLSFYPSNEDWEQLQSLDGGDESLSAKSAPYHSPNEQVHGEYPSHVALGPKCTFIVTSTGRCLSFGTSEDGLLGRGPAIMKSTEPKSLLFPDGHTDLVNGIASVSVGARHAVALSRDGKVYAWGNASGNRLGYTSSPKACVNEENRSDETASENIAQSCVNDVVEWSPRPVDIQLSSQLDSSIRNCRSVSENDLALSMDSCHSLPGARKVSSSESSSVRVMHACAGYDSSVFVTASGSVLSCGDNSGRLGQGDINTNICSPKPMFGGLHLWRDNPS